MKKGMIMKGTLYMLESAIAILLMLTTLALVLRQPQETQELDIINYKLKVYNALEISDDVGDLRRHVLDNDVNAIKDDISTDVPPYLNYEIALYNKTGALTNEPTINSKNIITVSYFLAGHVGSYSPKEVRVFIWGFD